MQQRIAGLNAKWRNAGIEHPFRVRIGVNTGYCNVGNFGSTTRVDYTAFGENINLTSRMEGLNKYLGTRILMTGHTHAAIGPRLVGWALAGAGVEVIDIAIDGEHRPQLHRFRGHRLVTDDQPSRVVPIRRPDQRPRHDVLAGAANRQLHLRADRAQPQRPVAELASGLQRSARHGTDWRVQLRQPAPLYGDGADQGGHGRDADDRHAKYARRPMGLRVSAIGA